MLGFCCAETATTSILSRQEKTSFLIMMMISVNYNTVITKKF